MKQLSNEQKKAIEIALKISEDAFYDNYGAGNFPGSGYSNKPQSTASSHFGWRDSEKFKKFKKTIESILDESN